MKLPVPQRGQPVDVTLLSDIVASINDLYNQVVIKASAYASLWIPGGRKQVRSQEVKFYTNQVKVSTKGQAAGAVVSFEGAFDIGFAFPPIVTVSPYGNSGEAKQSTAVLTEVTSSYFKGTLKLEKAATQDISINVIAIGQPT